MLIYLSMKRKRRQNTHYHYHFMLLIPYYSKYSTMINVFKSKQKLRRYSWTKVHVE